MVTLETKVRSVVILEAKVRTNVQLRGHDREAHVRDKVNLRLQ